MKIKCPICGTEYEEGTVRFCKTCLYPIGTDLYLTNLLNRPSAEDLKLYKHSLEEYRALWEERKEEQQRIEEENRKKEERHRIEEENRKKEERHRIEEENRKKGERHRVEEEIRKKEEQQRIEEEKKRLEQENKKKDEARRRKEAREQKKITEQRAKKKKLIKRVAVAVICLFALVAGYYSMSNYFRTKQMTEDSGRVLSELQVNMVSVEGGTFTMGSNSGELDEKPVHQVTVGSFLIGKYEVTQYLWESLMGSNPSNLKGTKRAVEMVNWYETIVFCNKLSELEGLTAAYKIDKSQKDPQNTSAEDNLKWIITCDFNTNGYRLPTEAEWEYAARGGNKSKGYKYSGSNDFNKVKKKVPNELGIFDMSGNVWEWCWDWKGDYSSGDKTNPLGPQSGDSRVNRGGTWFVDEVNCRVADREFFIPGSGNNFLGFRLARTKI